VEQEGVADEEEGGEGVSEPLSQKYGIAELTLPVGAAAHQTDLAPP
jgi:hypothetical protein